MLAAFIDATPIGNGLDFDEAVEDALHEAQNLNWSEKLSRFYDEVAASYEESGFEIEIAERFLKP